MSNKRTLFGIGRRRKIASKLVDQNVTLLLLRASGYELAANFDVIACGIGLHAKLDTMASTLSQGEKKLLDIASAFALNPTVILLDEPTSGVSTGDKHAIMEVLVTAAKASGVRAIVQVEHDMDLVERYSHRIVALQGGMLLADMLPDVFFADPEMISAVVGTRPRL